jgi:hypothetical protein
MTKGIIRSARSQRHDGAPPLAGGARADRPEHDPAKYLRTGPHSTGPSRPRRCTPQEGRETLTRQDTRHSSENACACLSGALVVAAVPFIRGESGSTTSAYERGPAVARAWRANEGRGGMARAYRGRSESCRTQAARPRRRGIRWLAIAPTRDGYAPGIEAARTRGLDRGSGLGQAPAANIGGADWGCPRCADRAGYRSFGATCQRAKEQRWRA